MLPALVSAARIDLDIRSKRKKKTNEKTISTFILFI